MGFGLLFFLNLPLVLNHFISTETRRRQTFVVLLAGEPEAGVEVAQHVLVLARLPDVLDGVGQLFPPHPGQLLFLHRGQRDVGHRALWIRGGGLWAVEHTETSVDTRSITERVPERLVEAEASKAAAGSVVCEPLVSLCGGAGHR